MPTIQSEYRGDAHPPRTYASVHVCLVQQHGGSASPRPPSDGASPAAFVKKQKTDRNSNGGKPSATSPGQNKKPFQAGPPKDKDRKPQFSPKEQPPRQHERPQQQQKQPPRQQDRQPPRQQDRQQQQHNKRQEGVSHKPAHLPSSQPQKPAKGRHYTVSVAVATSILNNVQSMELRTYVVGEVRMADLDLGLPQRETCF